MWTCIICAQPMPDYKPEYCCGGTDCACLGLPIYPALCSQGCHDACMQGIGKPYDERRKDAGIELWVPCIEL